CWTLYMGKLSPKMYLQCFCIVLVAKNCKNLNVHQLNLMYTCILL
uniref:Uncharacterized protein n=1 Tax=Macaca fascicularis TaxID=9541 RepID=A0A7N9DG27_MACFA